MKDFKKDPDKYARMSEPFPLVSDGVAALEAFMQKVELSRESYRIAEVVVIAAVYTESDDDRANERRRVIQSDCQFGNYHRGYQMVKSYYEAVSRTIADAITGDK